MYFHPIARTPPILLTKLIDFQHKIGVDCLHFKSKGLLSEVYIRNIEFLLNWLSFWYSWFMRVTSTLSAIPNPPDSICHFMIKSWAAFVFLTAITTWAPDCANCLHDVNNKKKTLNPQVNYQFPFSQYKIADSAKLKNINSSTIFSISHVSLTTVDLQMKKTSNQNITHHLLPISTNNHKGPSIPTN